MTDIIYALYVVCCINFTLLAVVAVLGAVGALGRAVTDLERLFLLYLKRQCPLAHWCVFAAMAAKVIVKAAMGME